jgi:pimeloyl-ACP methyl ester carboxylesterase
MKLELITREPVGKAKEVPLLFVHGKWHGAWCWDEHFLPYFAGQGYACAALSLRGHGGSEGREKLRWASIADYVSDVERVAGRFDAPPVIIGHSMGGFITQKYLEKHPQHPAAVLLTPIPPSGVWPSTFIVLRERPLVLLKALATLRLYPVVETRELARWALFSESFPEQLLEKYHPFLQDESFRSYLDELGLNLVRPKRVKTPLLVIGGENDRIIPPYLVQRAARAYRTEAIIFPGMAHDVMLETGWEAVAATILKWLNERGL